MEEWLEKIDKSGLSGKYKCWIFQHGLLPRLMWLLTIYDVTLTTVEGMERRFNKHLRKWLGVPPSFTSVGLYMRSGQLQLPLSSVTEEFKVAKCRLSLTYRDSQDKIIRDAGIKTRSGRKWSANTAIQQAESTLQMKDVIGNICAGRQGLGAVHFQQWSNSTVKEKQDMIHEEVRNKVEEERRAKAIGLGTQGAWSKWDLPKRTVTWSDLWRMEPFRISFLLRAVYDTLPSPVNLHKWGMRENSLCKLCGSIGTMAHILSGCKIALSQGRYRWRHDKVLMTLADILEQERIKKHPSRGRTAHNTISFVKAGQKPTAHGEGRQSLLHSAPGWEMVTDLGKRLIFPEGILSTTLRPDLILWSQEGKKVILVELTVPWEEGCEEAAERKKAKYQALVQECQDKGWTTWLFAVEVGCRGFPANSVWSLLTKVGVRGQKRKAAARRLGEAAERASCWLWHKREEFSWKPGGEGQ